MKKVLVSIEEFVNNGGALKKGRMLFTQSGIPYGEFKKFDVDADKIVYKALGTIKLASTTCWGVYVLVNAKPIYA